MKKLLFGIFMISVLNVNAQDWSTVYRQVDEVTLNEGLEEDYEKFESFWKILKQKHLEEGKILGWFVWKANKSSNNNAWTDYIILNIYENEQKMKEMNSKTQEWWMNELKSAHKGKTKRSVVKKYIKETLDNKYKKKIVSYTNKGIESYLTEQAAPQAGIVANYIGVEQLNEDYVDFETKLFLPYHKSGNTRLYWELNEIVDRTDNAYKPVTHIIFEIRNPESNNIESNLSFAEEMAVKYGMASRKFHGNLEAELVDFAFGN
jgi:hypothetical protein